jgi:hypothetical protein
MHCASFPRRLGQVIANGLLAQPNGMSTAQLADWVYGDGPRKNWHWWNIRRHMRARRNDPFPAS